MKKPLRLSNWAFGLLVLCIAPSQGATLYNGDNWSSLTSDRVARKVGDVLTVVVYENATATNTAENSSSKNNSFQGAFSAGKTASPGVDAAASLGLASASDNTGTTNRSGSMVAQISVVVDALLPNGDLHVSGAQLININGDKTNIRIEGRVRLADISPSNLIVSTSLADAKIDYDGKGFVSSSSEPGIVTRLLNWLDFP